MESNNTKISYETLWKFIIRPPKDEYEDVLLGKIYFTYHKKKYQRKDYDLISSEGYIMKCSFFEPLDAFRPSVEMPVVLYLHGNSSSRIEGINILEVLLKHNINLFTIDFPGCGHSEGEYISLGYHEKDDVKIIVDFIDNLPGVSKIGIWGRSMGAATTLLYAHKDQRISAICVDSPFEEFKRLAEELVSKHINLPKFIIDGALKIVRGTIKKKNGLDINKLRPIDQVSKTYQPALFIHAINDELIKVDHSINLFNNYGGPKSLKCCDKGGHNTTRPKNIKNQIGDFFYKYLCTNASEEENQESNTIHNYKIINDIEEDYNNDFYYENEDDINYEYENYYGSDYEELKNIYEEDYIVSEIIKSQNGGKKENKENITSSDTKNNKNDEKNKTIRKSNERIQNNLMKEKLQIEEMKEAFKNLNINNINNIQQEDDNNNIINDNNDNNDNNNFTNNKNIFIDNDEEEYKNNSNSPTSMENGGKFDFNFKNQ